jgi:ketosteroid isomerase-like protein
MSEAEELIREIWDRWNRGDREFDAEIIDPEIEIESALAGGTYVGAAGVLKWIEEIEAQFSDWQLRIDRIEELDDGKLAVTGGVAARGRQSGVALEQPLTWIVEVEDGRIRRLRNLLGHRSADEARR